MTERRIERLQPGQRVADRYRVEGMIGQGVMGTVYRVLDETVGETRALKLMSLDLHGDPKLRERFVHEAALGERIGSEYVVKVWDTGTTDRDVPFYVMELLEGEDLGRWLAHHPYVHEDRVAIVRELLRAIAVAHEAKVIHRDLKPENLFLSGSPGAWRLKVLDFGVAKVMREITKGGTAPGLGTPLWTAPEQGKEQQVVKLSADVWALGLLAFRLLADKLYWRTAEQRGATAFDLAMEMLREPIGPPVERARQLEGRPLPEGFDAWFLRCVDREPEKRFPSAGEALAAFEAMMSGDDGADDVRPAASVEGGPLRSRRAPRAALLLGLVVLAVLGVLTAVLAAR